MRAVPRGVWALVLICSSFGCKASKPGDVDAGASVSVPPVASSETLASRPEVIARADELAVQGARTGGAAGAELTRHAAELRRRIWRLERRETDAREAIELYRDAERAPGNGACAATLARATLEAELLGDPRELYRELYLVAKSGQPERCRADARRALALLEAWKPAPSALAELDRTAARLPEPDAKPGPAAVSSARFDPAGSVVVPIANAAEAARPARITNIERYAGKDSARVVVHVTNPTRFEVGAIEAEPGRGPRLFVDVERATYDGRSSFELDGIVTGVRIGARDAGARIVLDLARPAHRRVFYLPEPFRLVIDVSKQAPEPVEARQGQPVRVRRVVLDPGHGGHDPGAVGPGGLREKDVTLDIAHRAAPLIARELGIVTLLTRDSDGFIALDERAARANAFHADLFISIHCNASEHGGGRGIMTFVLDESRDDLAARIAARENAASQAAGAELASAMNQVLDVGSRARSLYFAELLQRATLASVHRRYPDVTDHGIRRAGFYVLAGARMPAVLFESSFISNAEGEQRLNSGDYRQRLADGIVNAVRAYREGRR